MLVTTENFEEILLSLNECEILTCDTETNWTQHDENRRLIGIGVGGVIDKGFKPYYFPFRHNHTMQMHSQDNNLPLELLQKVLDLLQPKKTIWHNAKFDLHQLEKEGFVVEGHSFYDTMIMSYMENENKFSHELEVLAKLVGEKKLGAEVDSIAVNLGGGGKNKKEKDAAKEIGWSMIPPSMMDRYMENDLKIPWKLFKLFFPRIEKDEQIDLYPREARVVNLIRKMEAHGILVDVPLLNRLIEQTRHEIETLEIELGFEPSKPAQLAHRLYAVPPEGLGFRPQGFSARRSKEFSQGIPIMDKEVLSRLNHPEVDAVLRHRGLHKTLDTYYLGWLDKVDSTGRMHANFKQHGTVTTRWSCEKPNMMQLPRDVEKSPVKKLLRVTEGYELWEFDYSQIDFRLGSVYAECQVILDAYQKGGDVHIITAQNVGAYNQFPGDQEKARYVGKQTNYLTIYGGGPDVLKMQLWRDAKIDITRSECKVILDRFHEAYPEFKRVAAGCETAAKTRGYIKLWNGRRRHFREEYECRKAFNSLVQGGAAQIIIESMLMLDELDFRMVCQVHDSIWIELPIDGLEVAKEKVKEIMEWPSNEFSIPFPVDCKRLA